MRIKSFYLQQHCYVSLTTLYPGGFRTRVFSFLRRMRRWKKLWQSAHSFQTEVTQSYANVVLGFENCFRASTSFPATKVLTHSTFQLQTEQTEIRCSDCSLSKSLKMPSFNFVFSNVHLFSNVFLMLYNKRWNHFEPTCLHREQHKKISNSHPLNVCLKYYTNTCT
jgi:hypothetical protein